LNRAFFFLLDVFVFEVAVAEKDGFLDRVALADLEGCFDLEDDDTDKGASFKATVVADFLVLARTTGWAVEGI
jgi:hypothetical protein